MYRFRSIENLLGAHKELENQEIYFAPSDKLNDPMEGLLDIYWRGDSVVWKNFFKHYLMCLERVFSVFCLSGDLHTLTQEDIPIFKNRYIFPTSEYKTIYEEIEIKFFEFEYVKTLYLELAERESEIRRDELLIYIKSLHVFALESINKAYKKHRLIKSNSKFDRLDSLTKFITNKQSIAKLMNDTEKSFPNIKEVKNKFLSAIVNVMKEIDFINLYYEQNLSKNRIFIFYNFSEIYINKIEEMVYPKWYTSCFMSTCNNSSVWGHYGDKHEGVCLKFKSYEKDGEKYLNLKQSYGYNNSPNGDMIPKKFHKINYQNKHVQIDFFKSIGRLPIYMLEKMWYSDEVGNLSKVADSITHDEQNRDEWIEHYWANFYESATTKLTDWSYENEYRLLLNNMLHEYDSPTERKLNYDFNDLEGIIFGIKTSQENKSKIIKIVDEKCKNTGRSDFPFYQAYYSKDTGKIETFRINTMH